MSKDYEVEVTVTLEGVMIVEGASDPAAAREEAIKRARQQVLRNIGDELDISLVDGQVR